MTRSIRRIVAASLVGGAAFAAGLADRAPDGGLVQWQDRCLDPEAVVTLADRGRNGIAPGCGAAVLGREAAR